MQSNVNFLQIPKSFQICQFASKIYFQSFLQCFILFIIFPDSNMLNEPSGIGLVVFLMSVLCGSRWRQQWQQRNDTQQLFEVWVQTLGKFMFNVQPKNRPNCLVNVMEAPLLLLILLLLLLFNPQQQLQMLSFYCYFDCPAIKRVRNIGWRVVMDIIQTTTTTSHRPGLRPRPSPIFE